MFIPRSSFSVQWDAHKQFSPTTAIFKNIDSQNSLVWCVPTIVKVCSILDQIRSSTGTQLDWYHRNMIHGSTEITGEKGLSYALGIDFQDCGELSWILRQGSHDRQTRTRRSMHRDRILAQRIFRKTSDYSM